MLLLCSLSTRVPRVTVLTEHKGVEVLTEHKVCYVGHKTSKIDAEVNLSW